MKNWNANGNFTTNQPIIIKKLSLSLNTLVNYNNSNGFSNGQEKTSKRI